MRDHYDDGQPVRIKWTGEETRINQWSIFRGPGRFSRYTYTLVGHDGTFFYHGELEPLEPIESNSEEK